MVAMKDPKKRPRGRPRGRTPLATFQVQMDPTLHSQLLAALRLSRRTKRAELEMAVEAHLRGLSLWPPPADPS